MSENVKGEYMKSECATDQGISNQQYAIWN